MDKYRKLSKEISKRVTLLKKNEGSRKTRRSSRTKYFGSDLKCQFNYGLNVRVRNKWRKVTLCTNLFRGHPL